MDMSTHSGSPWGRSGQSPDLDRGVEQWIVAIGDRFSPIPDLLDADMLEHALGERREAIDHVQPVFAFVLPRSSRKRERAVARSDSLLAARDRYFFSIPA
jgi:hypothetical protein